ncbi:MAG: sulfite exporter TauE/SafE family protein [Betaproteobacteria bacterium]|nr:sulfite exporter TauE/SafE family protein [Betaproteobacteria bacterium]
MLLTPHTSLLALAAASILLLAYFIRGITGFGSGLIAVPLLALFLPLTFVVPLMLLMDFTASATLGHSNRQLVNWAELKPLIPGSIIGVVAGATLLLNLDQSALLTTLGLFVLAFALRSLLYLHGDKPISTLWAWPASLIGGTVSALFGTGGPPYVIYLTHRIRDKSAFRATTSLLFLMEGGLRGVVFAITGLLLQKELVLAYLGGLPLLALGLWLGSKVHVGLSNAQMARIIGALLLLSGGSLLWKAWH